MKILILSQRFWPEHFRINIIVNILKKKHKVFVLTEKPNYPNKNIPKKYKKKFFYDEKYKSIKISRIPTITRGENNIKLFLNYLNFIFWSSIKIFRFSKKIDLIFIYATSPIFQAIAAIIFSKVYKIPSVLWVQDLWPDVIEDLNIVNNKYFISIINFFVKLIYKNVDHILVQSESYKKKISQNIKNKNIKVFLNPENSNFKKIKKINKYKNFNITYAGNLGKAQSINCLIDAVKKVRNEKFIINIFGDGSEKKKLISLIKKNKLENKIRYFNSLSFQNLKKYLQKSDAFILFLKKGKALSNTLPAKVQTYLSFGKPIIVSANGEAQNFVKKNKIGFYANAENSDELSKQIIKCIKCSLKDRHKIFNNSRNIFFNDIELNKWTKRLISHFTSITRNKI